MLCQRQYRCCSHNDRESVQKHVLNRTATVTATAALTAAAAAAATTTTTTGTNTAALVTRTVINTHKSIVNRNNINNKKKTRSKLNIAILPKHWNGPQKQQQQQQQQHHHHAHYNFYQKFRTINQTSSYSFLFILLVFLISLSCNQIQTIHAINESELSGLVRVSGDDDSSASSDGSTSLDLIGNSNINNNDNRDANDNAAAARNPGGGSGGMYLDKIGSLEMSIAAVFNKVAYGTTTKRSIPDTVFIPNLTTVPTPQLTTFRYREKDKDLEQAPHHHLHQQQGQHHNRNYELDLERDHALPTSAPNADILKSNSNPTYPNPNRHHNHDRERERHRTYMNSTPASPVHSLLKKGHATIPMYPVEMPSYSPPSRSFFTPPLPPEYHHNPFAEQPTLRGTNSDTGIPNTGIYINRRPIPPPSLMPGHEKIPYRPPDLISNANINNGASKQPNTNSSSHNNPHKEPDNSNQYNPNSDHQRKKVLNTPAQKSNHHKINSNQMGNVSDSTQNNNNVLHIPSISRILSGSNGRKEDIPEVLLRTVTRPTYQPVATESSAPPDDKDNKNQYDGDSNDKNDNGNGGGAGGFSGEDNESDNVNIDDDFDGPVIDESENQPKNKDGGSSDGSANTKKVSTEVPSHQSDMVYSTQIIQNQAVTNSDKKKFQQSSSGGNNKKGQSSSSSVQQPTVATWTVAWYIHVYLSAILFTILAVYSIFKMIFYDKLTHLISQSYFICLHSILIVICLARIFFLCYDAYNIHSSFHIFISELLLNLPATFLTVAFAVLILFLLLRSLNHKTNRYSALMRPLTVIVGSSVHIILCITLHYVESYGQQRNQQLFYQQQQLLRNGVRNGNHAYIYNAPPRVLSFICQIIYIFICFSLGCFYLYIYKILKRVLRNKSQNYIHGYQNLSYAIHITIATALLFILLAALQIYGAISISTTRPLISSLTDIDWLQWGYQFSLRLIEVAIIALLSWVTGLKTGAAKVMQREKVMEQHNVSGFALFPCTSSSSQEHFETDYPAICNANTNLHTYTLRTGKPIYDDTFALNSLGIENPIPPNGQMGMPSGSQHPHHHHHHIHGAVGGPSGQIITKDGREYQIKSNLYDANTIISEHSSRNYPPSQDDRNDYLNDSGTIPDHYENPNFELRCTSNSDDRPSMRHHPHTNLQQNVMLDKCFKDPLGNESRYSGANVESCNIENVPENAYDFKNFERPLFTDRPILAPGNSGTEFRASKNLKALIKSNSNNYDQQQQQQFRQNNLGGKPQSHYNHHQSGALQTHNYNSFDRCGGIRKSGTLSNIGHGHKSDGSGSGHSSGHANALSTSNINAATVGRSSGIRTRKKDNRIDNDLNNKLASHHSSGMPLSNDLSMSPAGGQIPMPRQHIGGAGSAGVVGGGGNKAGRKSDILNKDSDDSVSNASSEGMLKRQQSIDHQMKVPSDKYIDNAQHSTSSGDSATSMLVAEHGFVRFRAMDEMASGSCSSSTNGDINIVNMDSPAMMQRHHKERSYTNT